MRLTRWKLMAGVLGLSMCGLAALAEPACRSVGITRRADEPKPDDAKPIDAAKPLPLPVPAPPPATEIPPAVIPAVEDKRHAPLTPPVPVEVKPIPMPQKNDTTLPPAVDIKLLEDVHKVQNPPVALPTLKEETKQPEPVAPIPVPTPTPAPADVTPIVPLQTPLTPPSTPAPTQFVVPIPEPVVPVKSEKPLLPEPKKTDTLPQPSPITTGPAIEPAPVPPKPAGVVSGKKLKVTLLLGDDKPWFEVKDGDEVVLKVTADGVNLMAAAEKSRPAGMLVATGGVTFRTLGGFGTCDELQVMPGTGEVIVTGKVAVTSNWGKSETTATADKMTFRLGGDAKK